MKRLIKADRDPQNLGTLNIPKINKLLHDAVYSITDGDISVKIVNTRSRDMFVVSVEQDNNVLFNENISNTDVVKLIVNGNPDLFVENVLDRAGEHTGDVLY